MATQNIEQTIKQKDQEIKQLKKAVSFLERRMQQMDVKIARALYLSRRNETELHQLQTSIRRAE